MTSLGEAIPLPLLIAFGLVGFLCVWVLITVVLFWPARLADKRDDRTGDERLDLETAWEMTPPITWHDEDFREWVDAA